MRQLKINKDIYTDRSNGNTDRYLSEISKHKLITPEKEVELAKKIHSGDGIARDQLVVANLRFVISVAKQYTRFIDNKAISLEDLISEGNNGLIIAANRFDETKGFKFISYAVWWIRQAITATIAANQKSVRIPLNKITKINKYKRSYFKLEQEFERKPTDFEISEISEISLEEINVIKHLDRRDSSLDACVTNENEESLVSLITDPESFNPYHALEEQSTKADLLRAIDHLSIIEGEVLKKFFGINLIEPMKLEQIGRDLELSRERIRQIRDKGLKKLRSKKFANIIGQYRIGQN